MLDTLDTKQNVSSLHVGEHLVTIQDNKSAKSGKSASSCNGSQKSSYSKIDGLSKVNGENKKKDYVRETTSIVMVQDAETHEQLSPHAYRGRYSIRYDEGHGWPATPEDEIMDWTHFCMNITSDEVSAEYVLQKIIPEYKDEWLDLRPYMIENPIKISVDTKLQDALELFYLLHLRHLIVTDPHNGKIAGIVTRQDLYAYMETTDA